MKNIVTTIIDIDELVAKAQQHWPARKVGAQSRRILKLTLEWELDAGGASSDQVGDEQPSSQTSWRDTIAQFPDD